MYVLIQLITLRLCNRHSLSILILFFNIVVSILLFYCLVKLEEFSYEWGQVNNPSDCDNFPEWLSTIFHVLVIGALSILILPVICNIIMLILKYCWMCTFGCGYYCRNGYYRFNSTLNDLLFIFTILIIVILLICCIISSYFTINMQ